MRCLVTGGSGMLGMAFIPYLIEKNKEVRIYDLVPHEGKGKEQVEFIQGSITDIKKLEDSMEGVDIVYHLASVIELSPKLTKLLKDVNILGTDNVIKCCKAKGVKKLVYVSTMDSVWNGKGPGWNGDIEIESLPYPVHADSGYHESKALAEQLVLKARSPELSVCIIRPAHIYGPKDIMIVRGINRYGVASPIRWPLGTLAKMSLVHAKNVSHGIYLAGEALVPNSVANGEIYAISEGSEHSPFEILSMVAESRKLPMKPFIPIPTFVMMIIAHIVELVTFLLRLVGIKINPLLNVAVVIAVSKNTIVPYTKAQRDLGYSPIITFEEGYKEVLDWFQTYKLD